MLRLFMINHFIKIAIMGEIANIIKTEKKEQSLMFIFIVRFLKDKSI